MTAKKIKETIAPRSMKYYVYIRLQMLHTDRSLSVEAEILISIANLL